MKVSLNLCSLVLFLISATALRNCHGRLILQYVIDYLTVCNKIILMEASDIWETFYCMLNAIGKFNYYSIISSYKLVKQLLLVIGLCVSYDGA